MKKISINKQINNDYESNYKSAINIDINKKKQVISESNKKLDEHPEMAKFISTFVNNLIIEKEFLKNIFSKEEIKSLKLLVPELIEKKKHTIFELKSLEKDLLSYHELSDSPRKLPSKITNENLESLLAKLSNAINTM